MAELRFFYSRNLPSFILSWRPFNTESKVYMVSGRTPQICMSCNHKCSVGLLVGTKNIPEFKSLRRIQEHFPESKITQQNPKRVPETKNTSKNPNYFGTCFGFWEVFLNSEMCFGFREVFWILGRVFEFWDVFSPYYILVLCTLTTTMKKHL